MSLEIINTIAALTTTLVIAATVLAALAQLRHLRAGNQIAGFLTLRNMLDDEAHQRAVALLEREGNIADDKEFRAYVKAAFTGVPAPHDDRSRDVRAAVIMLANSFEVVGTLVRNGIVDQRLFLEQYCSTIVNMWRRLAPYIVAVRGLQNDDGIWEDFEYLTVLSQQYMAKHPSVYPKGVPRLLPGSPGAAHPSD
jgi:hypothetical protein